MMETSPTFSKCARLAACIAVALVIGGCAFTGNVAPPVTPALVGAGHGASAETLGEGRRIFTGKCSACHASDPVEKYSTAEWRAAVDKMAPRAKLSADERSTLLAYLMAVKSLPEDSER
ncbi:MAG: hypothetical protein ABI680_19955 [Chthoniobacteraceae bacterium]